MSFYKTSSNLISDAWIPVLAKDGTRKVIAPWQMTDPTLARPDWPRVDLNLACWELLIGLVYLADPPADVDEWEARRKPEPDRLRERLAPFASAFELLGEGPRFLQEFGGIEGEANPVDMLFIDSAGGNAARNNADLMVRRTRYKALDPKLAAMALYTFQSHAPAGGAGNRTSMRGGGPMVTLVDPGHGLWDTVWANVPDGSPGQIKNLPWMRPTQVSKAKGTEAFPPTLDPIPHEAFFGMPRRLWLVAMDEGIIGVVQVPWGNNYTGWVHPLTPYYRMKAGGELLPRHPRAGRFGYRQWIGVVLKSDSETAKRAASVRAWTERGNGEQAGLVVGGWAMDNMKPRDFVLSIEPLIQLAPQTAGRLRGLIEAADHSRRALRSALRLIVNEGVARDAAEEELYLVTEGAFLRLAEALASGKAPEAISRDWLGVLKTKTLDLFNARAVPGLAARDTKVADIVDARRRLTSFFSGTTKAAEPLYRSLEIELPPARKTKEKA